MFAFVIPVAGVAVSSNVAAGGGVTVAAAVALGAAEYKYKAPSRAITHVYNKLPTIFASQEQREREREEIQRRIVENAFNELMNFTSKSYEEIFGHIETISNELDNREKITDREIRLKTNTETSDTLKDNLIAINCLSMSTLQIKNKIIQFQSAHNETAKISASDPRYISKISQMSDAENEIIQKLSNIRVEVMNFYNKDMITRLRSYSSETVSSSLKM